MGSWDLLIDLLIMLTAALVLGTVAEWLKQSAILGYLMAGTLVGPHTLGLVTDGDHVGMIAELGVALLLFTIGLEFSVRRLRRLGRVALLGGAGQIIVTLVTTAALAATFGMSVRAAVTLGAVIAISSTACVLRVLVERGAIDSVYGRNATGILLVQDASVIPLVILVLTLAGGGTVGEAAVLLGRTVGLTVLLIGGFLVLFKFIVPRMFNIQQWARNRELPILLAIIVAVGSASAAHGAGLSPAIGAFLAGVMLGESPFSAQIRSDIGSLRTLLVTLFFASIGMVGDPSWVAAHMSSVVGLTFAIVFGKAMMVLTVLRLLRVPRGAAVASALCLAQVGEFSVVIAQTAYNGALLDEGWFKLIVTTTILTLFLTPFLVALGPRLGTMVTDRFDEAGELDAEGQPPPPRDIVVIGFGPAGQAVAEALYEKHADRLRVIDLNARNGDVARRMGIDVVLGDASQTEVLDHAGVRTARAVAITVPDPDLCKTIIHRCRDLAPSAAIVVRSRYHQRRWELELAGARELVDEEQQVGLRIAALARRHLDAG